MSVPTLFSLTKALTTSASLGLSFRKAQAISPPPWSSSIWLLSFTMT